MNKQTTTINGLNHSTPTLDEIRVLPFFSRLSNEEAEWLIEHSETVTSTGSAVLFTDEAPPEATWFLIEGEWKMIRQIRSVVEPVVYITDRPGSWHGGIMAIDLLSPPTVEAFRASRFLRVPTETMHEMLRHGFPVDISLLTGMLGGLQLLHHHAADRGFL